MTSDPLSHGIGDQEKELLKQVRGFNKALNGILSLSRSGLSEYTGPHAALFGGQEGLEEWKDCLRRNLVQLPPLVAKYSDLVEVQEQVYKVAEEWEHVTEQREKSTELLAREDLEVEAIKTEIDAATDDTSSSWQKMFHRPQKESLQRKYAAKTTKAANYSVEISAATSNLEELASRFERLSHERRAIQEAANEVPFTLPGSHTEEARIAPTMRVDTPQPDTGQAEAGGADRVFIQIEKLAELHKAGILTKEEFDQKKSELLSRI